MRFIDLFAGIGGFRLGLTEANTKFKCVGTIEIDKYAVKSYNAIFEDEVKPTDVREVSELPEHELICGGFPCQSFSIAGKRGGFSDTRGTLFFEIMRIAKANNTSYLFLENVKGLLSHDEGRTFATILQTLDECGYDAQWEVLNSKNFGVPQNRERIFIIANLRGKPRPKVFPVGISNEVFIGKQGQKKIELIQQSGKEIARVYSIHGLGQTLKGKTGGWQEPIINMPIISHAIDAGYYKGIDRLEKCRRQVVPVLTPDRENKRQNGRRFKNLGEPSFTLTVQDVHGDAMDSQIRRLTPFECWRLQGFPDWTFEKAALVNSDTQLYKQAGNAVTVNVIKAIGEKLILTC